MGVPALFRWLSRKYPKIVLPVVEEQPQLIPGGPDGEMTEVPVNTLTANPNGIENDCLYLDMNGIVHPCTHPEGKPAPKTEGAMMLEVFKYTERVVNMTRPRKVLLMAIDGVAPRAKMNQQRSRRFRAADEAKTKAKEKEDAIKEWEAMGKELSDEYKNEKAWDSNAITPGTPFMDLLASSLRYWVAYKMNTDPGWANLQVIISDASVPGEGEHKIMDYVRRQRSQPGYDPNTTHVFYGLDADLIMLSLATHEPNFRILREDVFAQAAKRGCHKCGQPGHHSSKCVGIPLDKKKEMDDAKKAAGALKPFIFLDVSILREYLQVELNVPGLPFSFDLERAIDDWVFMIFFVGNDFLPHLPSLEIREGAIDMLLNIWRKQLPHMGGYLSDNGIVHLDRAQYIMDGLAEREDEIFRKRRETERRQDANDRDKRRRIDEQEKREKIHAASLGQNEDTTTMRNGLDYVPVLQPTAQYQSAQQQQQQQQSPQNGSASGIKTESPSTTSAIPGFAPAAAGSILSTFANSLPNKVAPPVTTVRGKAGSSMFIKSAPRAGTAPARHGLPGGTAANSGAPTSSVIANRAAIRKANLSAAEMLKAELAGGLAGPPVGSGAEPEAAHADEEEAKLEGGVKAETEMDEAEAVDSSIPVKVEGEGDAIVSIESTATITEPDGTMDAILSKPSNADSAFVEEDVPASALNGEGAAVQADIEVEDSKKMTLDGDDSATADTKTDGNAASSPVRGKKRSADEAEIPANRSQAEAEDAKEAAGADDDNDDDEDADADDDDDDEDDAPGDVSIAVTAPAPIVTHKPAPLKVVGGNMVEQEDTVKLWEAGYKERYYEQKFGIKIDDADFRRGCAKAYVEGLAWVLAYYYNGCPSWTWYYPYHFAPFASDFTDLATMDVKFETGKPFKPFEQLMGVFPAASRVHIPSAFQGLMIEEDSEIIDFYPEEFSVDMNGKKMLWQGVALLPFIDQDRLLAALAKRYPNLSEDEVRRNSFGEDVIFVNEDNKLYNQICSLYL